MNSSFGLKLLGATLVGFVTVYVIDPLDPSTISTPFCLGMILMGLSLRQSTSLVVAVSLIYSVLTVIALIDFHRYYIAHFHPVDHPYFWLFQRIGLFLVVCLLSIYLARYRTDTERILARFQTILSKLPAPVIISNVAGNIVYVNDAVAPLFHQNPAEIIGKSYFDYVLTESMKGKSIRAYFETFETETKGSRDLELRPFGTENKASAQLICLGSGQNRIMITMLPPPDKSFLQSIPLSTGALLTDFSSVPPKL